MIGAFALGNLTVLGSGESIVLQLLSALVSAALIFGIFIAFHILIKKASLN